MQGPLEFHYRDPRRAVSSYPGSHPSNQRGGGFETRGLAPLYVSGDPRRLDLRASLRDPFGRLLVRTFNQRSIVRVFVLADVSASMSFVAQTCKFDLMVEFVGSLAYSAHRVGDPFAFTACDTVVRRELSLSPTRAQGAGQLVTDRLRRWVPNGAGATGLLTGAEQIPGARALVFLVSDFHLPVDLLHATLSRLSAHAVIPVILVDSAEGRVPGVGIAHLFDPEIRSRRTLLIRRSLAKRIEEKLREHRQQVVHCLAEHDLRPLYLIDRFEPEIANRYFCE